MSFMMIFLGIVLALICVFFKRLKLSIGILILVLMVTLSMGTGVLPHFFMNALQSSTLYETKISTVWAKKNLILILGMGTIKIPKLELVVPGTLAYSRILEGASLYHTCKKSENQCKILVSGGDISDTGKSEAEVYKNELLKLGIDNVDILVETQSHNTFENAEFSAPLIQQEKPDQIFLVTAGIHMKRALLYSKHFGIDAIPVPADYMRTYPSVLPIGYNITMSDFALHEYIGILRYSIYQFFGWNKPIISSSSPKN
jgi:uncharacterized SAM-binding protein YcdF (DUF218 family)